MDSICIVGGILVIRDGRVFELLGLEVGSAQFLAILKIVKINFFFFIKVFGSFLLSVKRGLLGEVWG